MPIRIGVQVDSGNKIGKLAKDIEGIGASLEKTGPEAEKAAKGVKAAGQAMGSFAKQSLKAQEAASNLFATYKKIAGMKSISLFGRGGSGGTAELVKDIEKLKQSLKELNQVSRDQKTDRKAFYGMAAAATETSGAVKVLTGSLYEAQTAAFAQEHATKLLMQSEAQLEASLGRTIALKERGYAASLKRAEAAKLEAAAVQRLVLANKSVTGKKGRSNIAAERMAAALKSIKASENASIALMKERAAALKASMAYAEKGRAALKAGAEAKIASGLSARMSLAASGSMIAPSAMKAMGAAALAKSNVQLDKHNNLVKKTSRSYTNMDSAIRGLSGGFGKLWMTYGNIAPMMAGFAAAATAVDSFQQAMDVEYITTYTAALADTTGALGLIQEEVLGMRDLASGPKELAEGFREMIKAGEDVETVLSKGVLETMSKFSTISGQDLASSIQLAVTQVNAFAEVTKKSTGVTLDYASAADMMVAAVHSAPITFQDLSQSLKHTTELATTVGASFDEIATALALVGKAGIKGSMAGTALRTGLEKLVTPSNALSETVKVLGINI